MRTARDVALAYLLWAVIAFGQGGQMNQAGESVNRFFCALLPELSPADGNLFFSPASIWTALTMTSAGAAGETEAQMRRVLSLPSEDIHRQAGRLLSDLNARGQRGNYELSVANSLWPQKGYPFLPAFVSLVKEFYGARLYEVDYVADAEGARGQINRWVEKETREKIRDIVPQGAVDRMTRLVLANAIYFKGKWQEQFRKEDTRDDLFTKADGKKIPCRMMHRKGTVGYLKGENFSGVEMDYAGGEISMLILLPDRHDGLRELEKKLTPENLTGWTRRMRRQEVILFVPRFSMTSSFDLGETLARIGMKDAFDPQAADFSRMDGRRDLFISKVLHKAFVDVNEEGTEAAAATTVIVAVTAMPAEPVVFRADHPFFFVLRDRATGTVLFAGRVAEPK